MRLNIVSKMPCRCGAEYKLSFMTKRVWWTTKIAGVIVTCKKCGCEAKHPSDTITMKFIPEEEKVG